MERDVLLKKIHMDCPLCDKTHEVEERLRMKMRMSLKPAL